MISHHSRLTSKLSQSFFFLLSMGIALVCAVPSIAQSTATNIQVTSAAQQTSVKRLGVNLGDETYWDSGQITKNLVFQNPGFEAMKYRSIMVCAAVSSNTCTDDNQYSPQPTGFWTGGTYTILSGNAAGTTGSIVSSTQNPNSSCAGCGQIIQFDKNLNTSVGDYFVLTNNFPGSGDAGWWDNTSGGGTITTETNDLSPETPGKQAVVLNAATAGKSALITSYFDNENGKSFIQLNGNFAVTFRAKGIGGNNQLSVSVQRMESPTIATYLSQTVTLTNTWQDYTLTFSANETGSATGTVQLVFGASGSAVELDDVSLAQTNSSTSNPTAFRDDVVTALKQLNPGTIRMMAAGAALGSDLPNQLQVPFARYREGYSTGATSENALSYGIHEFLQLCQTVGSDPWITIPTATTTTEMTDFIEYLTGTGSDPWSALRISRGQSAPWTTVFNKIHIEFGNETWNGSFRGESMNSPAYPELANQIFGAARQTPGYVASNFDLVLDGFAGSPGYNQGLLAVSTQHDSMDIAPYLLYSANNEAQATMFGALLAEPEIFEGSAGEVYGNMTTAQTAPTPTYLNVYETNLGTMVGDITEAQLNTLTPSIGAGLAHTDHMLQMMRLGVRYQNAFSLTQYNFKRSDGNAALLWGIVLDMGKTNLRRPQFLTQAMANSVIGGTMLQTVQLGANPTWNQPLSSDGVILSNAHDLQSFAFQNGNTLSAIVFNLSQTSALPVTFSGSNAPSGSVQMTQITSANITDNNETGDVVAPATQTLSGFNAATGLSLPPYSMTVLSWAATATQAPVFSLAGGTYTTAQTVRISDLTPGATIYYTTDGSTPTTSSTVYSGAITVSGTKTLQAIATSSTLTPSEVTSATYSVVFPPAATPAFSVPAGTYTSVQTVTITDATAGSTIYYTTNGSTPTTASTKYTGAITVGSNETLQAIATANQCVTSSAASAAYVITLPVATPVLSVGTGTYNTTQTVTMTDATPGATIYYTTNGSTPTTASTVYTGAITVSATETLQAFAAETNYVSSAVVSAKYTINPPAAMPTVSVPAGTYSTTQQVNLVCATNNSAIHYTTDGTTPTSSSTMYTGMLTISTSQTVKAVAVAYGYSNSPVAVASYVIGSATAATPVFSVAAGTYTSAQTVSISDATAGAAIYYTTNGTTPTTASNKYAGAISVSATETLEAIAVVSNYANSAVASAVYTINLPAATPAFSVAAGTYTSVQTVSITDATAGATIYYTTNGSTPTTASTKYAGAITVPASETLQAIAVASNYTSSAIASAAYTINLPAATPAFSVAAGTYTSAQTVSISDATAGATIYFTTNGSTPTTASSVYSGAITVGASEMLQAIAVAPNYSSSAVASAAYTINLPAAMPLISLAAGSYTTTQTVTITDAIAGATIYYTTDGTMPTTASNVYTGAIAVNATETLQAIAIAPNFSASPVATAAYTVTLPAGPSYASGFTGSKLSLNGTAALSGSTLQLVNNQVGAAGSAWFPTKVSVTEFTTDFDFQLPTSNADGFTFAIQNASQKAWAMGGNGGGLGYEFMTNSVALSFDLYQSGVNNAELMGVYTGGVTPQGSSVSLTGTGLNLHSGDPFHVHIVYAGTTMMVTVTDNSTGASFTTSFTVNVASSVGASTAYVGFTGSTGSLTSTQNILDWTFHNN